MNKAISIFLLIFVSTLLMADNSAKETKCILCHDKSGRINQAKVSQTLAQWGANMTDEERKLQEHAMKAALLKR